MMDQKKRLQNHKEIRTVFRLKDRVLSYQTASTAKFEDYLKTMKDHMRENQIHNETDDRYKDLNKKALLNDPNAVIFFMTLIENYVRTNPFQGQYASAYNNVIEALYHEWKGFGSLYKWFTDKKFSMSDKLQVIGTNVYYTLNGKYIPYPYPISSQEKLNHIKRSLLINEETLSVDDNNPEVELKMDDPLWDERFIRIAMMVKPRVWDGYTTITMRRQVVGFMTLDEQAGTRSIPFESVNMIRSLAKTYNPTSIAGIIGSGKTTFANTLVGELMLSGVNKTVALIENHPESVLPYVFKNQQIIPIISSGNQLITTGIQLLRHDVKGFFLSEVRKYEWELIGFAAEKGFDWITFTYHTPDAEDIAYQGAMHIYSQIGGNLKSHLISTLKACRLVYIMEPTDNQRVILSRVSEIVYDKKDQSVKAVDLMRYNQQHDSWEYHNGLSKELIRDMNKKNPEATQEVIKQLNHLAALHPMTDPIKESLISTQVMRGDMK